MDGLPRAPTEAGVSRAPDQEGAILLINVSGQDKPGLLAMLTSALAGYQARVLDIGQAVIHEQLNLGMLVQLPPGCESAAVQQGLSQAAKGAGVAVRFEAVDAQAYQAWVAGHGKSRYIVTLLASGISAEQLARTASVVERHGLNIDTVRRLSGRVPLDGMDRRARASVEMSVRGPGADQRELKAALFQAAGELTFDFSVQEDSVYRRNRRLVAFDMDSTLIDAEVIDELAARHGVGEQVSAITAAAMRGEWDFKESLRCRVALLEGLPEAVLAEVAASVHITEGTHRLLNSLQRLRYRTAIISGGFEYVGRRLREKLRIDYLFANSLEVENGRLTGRVGADIVDAPRKAEILEELCRREGISTHQAIAIGDGANDLPMLTAAGLGIAFHAKPVVRASAGHAISNFGLDSVLYLLGFSDREIAQSQ